MTISKSILFNADSYKYGMHKMYPPNTEYVYSYLESRGGKYDATLFFGLQAFIKEYLLTPITQEDIDKAEALLNLHGEPFNREGWEYILNEHGGKLPIKIYAVPEGSIVPTSNVLVTIVNTDPKCWWSTTFLETAILRGVWYPTTVATNSYASKKVILNALSLTGDINKIDYMLHDFGQRGVSSFESSGLGGMAHLVNFKGTDNVNSLLFANEYYNEPLAGYSVPATEHSVITSWLPQNEQQAYLNLIQQYGKNGIISCVSDSYDIYNACHMWGQLKDQLDANGTTLVIRPDSGNPLEVIPKCLAILEQYFGFSVNDKGYKILDGVMMLWGDGITTETIEQILTNTMVLGYSANNFIFGQGGALLQQLDRDTCKFAVKCSAAYIDGQWVDVFKDPITDKGKASKKGRVVLCKNEDQYYTSIDPLESCMQLVYENGALLVDEDLSAIRYRANSCCI